jgi:hypothetical protein
MLPNAVETETQSFAAPDPDSNMLRTLKEIQDDAKTTLVERMTAYLIKD